MKNQPPTHSTAEAPDQVLINLKGKHLQLLNFPEKEHVSQLNRECIFVSLLQCSIPANLLPWQTLSTIQSHIYLLPSCSVRCHLQVPVHWALHPFIVTFLRVCVCVFFAFKHRTSFCRLQKAPTGKHFTKLCDCTDCARSKPPEHQAGTLSHLSSSVGSAGYF